MDWCLDTRVEGAADLVETDVTAHLARHAIDPALAELGRPVVRSAIDGRGPGVWWLTIDWTDQLCVLRVRPTSGATMVGDPIGPGAARAHEHAARLLQQTGAGAGDVHPLDVPRRPERDIDPPASRPGVFALDQPAHLVGMISAGMDGGRNLEEAAALAGAGLADQHPPAVQDGRGPDMERFAREVIEAEERLGGDFELVDADGSRVVLRNRRCPFGPSTTPSMCRFTSALAGRMAAREAGGADVTILESLAAGDPECRLVIDGRPGLDPRISHHYAWPPSGGQAASDSESPSGRSFQVTLSLQLPRDRMSVPITRHLIRAAMDEIGVVAEDADGVDLAVTEACANVIDHSGPGDVYDVAVAMTPDACHIRVVDVGRGFDHQALALSTMADEQAEHGRGVALMHALVDQVRFESEPEKGTVVHLVKLLSFHEGAAAHQLMAGPADR